MAVRGEERGRGRGRGWDGAMYDCGGEWEGCLVGMMAS